MERQRRSPFAIHWASKNFEPHPTLVQPFLYHDVAGFSRECVISYLCTYCIFKRQKQPHYLFSFFPRILVALSITKHSSALYIGMTKVLPIIDELGYDGQNSSFSSSSSSSDSSSCSDSTPITQKGSHIST